MNMLLRKRWYAPLVLSVVLLAVYAYAGFQSNQIQHNVTVNGVRVSTTLPASFNVNRLYNENLTVTSNVAWSGFLYVWILNTTGGTSLISPNSFTLFYNAPAATATAPNQYEVTNFCHGSLNCRSMPSADGTTLEINSLGASSSPVCCATAFNFPTTSILSYGLDFNQTIVPGTTYQVKVGVTDSGAPL